MRIFVINPNTSESITEHIRRELEKIKRPSYYSGMSGKWQSHPVNSFVMMSLRA